MKEPVAFFSLLMKIKEILIEILKENNLYNNFYEHEIIYWDISYRRKIF